MWAVVYLRSPVSQSFFSHPHPPLVLSLSPSAVLLKADTERAGKCWEGNGTRGNSAERGWRRWRRRRRRRRRRQEEKEGHVFCFCSHYSSPAGRYPGRQCSVGWGFGRRVISGSAGGASVTFFRIARSQKARVEGAVGRREEGAVQSQCMAGLVGFPPLPFSHGVLGNEEAMSLDVN